MTCPHCLAPLPQPRPHACPACGQALPDQPGPMTPAPSGGDAMPPPLPVPVVPPPPPASVATPSPVPPLPAGVPPALPGLAAAPVPVPAPVAGPPGTPWERRQELGTLTALIDTVQLALLRPRELFALTRVGDGLADPLIFAVGVGYVSMLVGALYNFVVQLVLGPRFWIEQLGLGHLPGLSENQLRTQAVFGLCGNAVLGPFFLVIGLFIHTGLVHLMLMALGAARRGFEGTWRATCYAQAASLCVLVPICGSLAAIPWSVVITSLGLRHIHETSTGRATLAAAAPLLLACCCLSLLGALLGVLFGVATGAAR